LPDKKPNPIKKRCALFSTNLTKPPGVFKKTLGGFKNLHGRLKKENRICLKFVKSKTHGIFFKTNLIF